MAQLLTPGTGRLFTILFPIVPGDRLDGPPFPVTVDDYRAVLEPHGIVMDVRTAHLDNNNNDDGDNSITAGTTTSSSSLPLPVRSHPDTVGPRKGKEMVCWWVKSLDSHL
jgi:hypothetical protein